MEGTTERVSGAVPEKGVTREVSREGISVTHEWTHQVYASMSMLQCVYVSKLGSS
jgi:hypothetical protein